MNDFWVVPDPLNRLSKILIMNRYGKLIKEIIDFSEAWNVIYRNRPLHSDDYCYVIHYTSDELILVYINLLRKT